MKISIAQLDPIVGDFQGNFSKIRLAYESACQDQARFLVTPELSICGYPPQDLLERPEFLSENEAILEKLLELTRGKKTAILVGHVTSNEGKAGRPFQNMASVLEDGERVFSQPKMLLPTYDVFEEDRYFEPASAIHLWNCEGKKIAIGICEDFWAQDTVLGRQIHDQDPVREYMNQKADLLVSLSASPYEWEKRHRRELLHADIAKKVGAPLLYTNMTGATDEMLFSGGSFAASARGKIAGRLKFFHQQFGTLKWQEDSGEVNWVTPERSDREDPDDHGGVAPLEILHRALVCGIQDYFARTGFQKAVLGLSGGIDSAVVACLAAEALGPDHVLGIAMPSQHSSAHSYEDAEGLAKNLGIDFHVRPIKFVYSVMQRELSEFQGKLNSLALENLQARIRGNIVMTLANHNRGLALATGNKSELAMGYCTLYGDMVGALAPIGDLLKTRVYELARQINLISKNPIPLRSIEKAPSAELRESQTDQDALPSYSVLDPLLEDYLEKGLSVKELEARHTEREEAKKDPFVAQIGKTWVRHILRVLEGSEFKRRQAALVLKASPKAFGGGRRYPVSKKIFY